MVVIPTHPGWLQTAPSDVAYAITAIYYINVTTINFNSANYKGSVTELNITDGSLCEQELMSIERRRVVNGDNGTFTMAD